MSDGDFTDLRGKEIERADLTGARFTSVRLTGATFRACELSRIVMRGVELVDATIDGEIHRLVVNGVDVAPLVEAELDRRHPDRPAFRPTTPEGFRHAWDRNERLWESTVARARRLSPELRHESVDGETFPVRECLLIVLNEEWCHRGYAERDLTLLEERG